ncbi:MAG TPA: G1 family glutamic endopeptidase [Solirubrobacteraceae bacterium]|nr:G1 family glutamic endopeptidase [Solirubrobacteraceae bacterium]
MIRRPLLAAAARRGPRSLLAACTALLVAAPAALADSTQSSNWAGYAAHSPRVHFTRVFGAWRQPTVTCTPGAPTYSSEWVGLGGYNIDASALEQIGSEIDCNGAGRPVSTVWYELVPAPSHNIAMTVAPGDQLSASVSVVGHLVRLQLSDLTRGRTFVRTVRVTQLDTTSADWIVEAPSECSNASSCQQLPLANFGTTAMTRAATTTSTGHRAAISDPLWRTTQIRLAASGRRFIGNGASAGADANPSDLVFGSTAFAVTYAGSTTAAGAGSYIGQRARSAVAARRSPGGLARPGRRR